jgi:daunorubicin resistance ABC transporter ATP-binding subunit
VTTTFTEAPTGVIDAGGAAIAVHGVTRRYGDHLALDQVSLTVPAGTVLALLGHNGAGKTTLVRILTTLLPPDAGHAEIAGLDVVRDAEGVRRRIGLLGQRSAVDDHLTGRENLELVARLLHRSRAEARDRAATSLDRFGLDHVADRVVSGYSGGLRRRLDVAVTLLAAPAVLFLDEPTTGLDPVSRRDLWELIASLADGGTTVLLTTQYLDEADHLADQVAVLDQGRLIAEGTPDELRARLGGDTLVVRLARPDDGRRAVAAIDALVGGGVELVDGALATRSPDAATLLPTVLRHLDAADVEVTAAEVRRPTLDDVFLALTGRRRVEPDAPDPRPARHGGHHHQERNR